MKVGSSDSKAEEDGSVFCWGAGEIFQLKQKQVTESVQKHLELLK